MPLVEFKDFNPLILFRMVADEAGSPHTPPLLPLAPVTSNLGYIGIPANLGIISKIILTFCFAPFATLV